MFVYVGTETPAYPGSSIMARRSFPGSRVIIYEDGVKRAAVYTGNVGQLAAVYDSWIYGEPGQFAIRVDYSPGHDFCPEKIYVEMEICDLTGLVTPRGRIRPRFTVTPSDPANAPAPPVTPDPPPEVPPVTPDPPPEAPLELPPVPDTDITVIVDGAPINFMVDGELIEPVNINGRILVPVRPISVALGATPSWDSGTATLTRDGMVVSMTVGDNFIYSNGARMYVSQGAIMIGDRVFLPLRYAFNGFGISDENITWDGATQTAGITT